ncbi:MAG: hypothetical protein AB7N73_14960 [Gemmatimonadales bacterium]
MDPCTVGVLGGVFVGWALGAGTQPRAIARALGQERTARLLRLLELLDVPEDDGKDKREPDA